MKKIFLVNEEVITFLATRHKLQQSSIGASRALADALLMLGG